MSEPRATGGDGAAPRAAAARAVAAVLGGRSLDPSLTDALQSLAGADRALAQALAYGVLREQRALQGLAERLLRDAARTPPAVLALISVGLHQLRDTRVPAHAAVAATVDACALLRETTARGLVNAVLRRYQREATRLEASLPGTPAWRHSYPDWLATAVKHDWPGADRAVLAAGNVAGPMTLRVNRRRGDRNAYAARLAAAGQPAAAVAGAADALRLETPCPVDRLPGFADGDASVQDASAQLAAPLLDARAGMRVLDACAAPGGKTAHLLEGTDDLDVLALDSDRLRLGRLDDTLTRLGLKARTLCADAADTAAWWDGRPFDRILLDAPCSGTGVIRRHPDIKWLRRDSDIPALARVQHRLLEALWPLLAADGALVYATCSVLDAEGAAVVESFLRRHDDAREWVIADDAGWGEATRVGRRIAPGGDWDGFYFARLRRVAPSKVGTAR